MFLNQSPHRLHMTHSQKSLTLHWYSVSEWGSDRVVYCFAKEGCQYVGYGKQWPGHVSITIHTRLKIIDAPLTLIFRMGLWPCCSLFCQRRLPVRSLWKAAARLLFNYHTYKTKNCWYSIDAYFRMGQWPCCSLFCQRRLPVRSLWKATARSLFNNHTSKTNNRWRSVDTHFNVLCIQDLLPLIIAFIIIWT
jgi:hypothetical protein